MNKFDEIEKKTKKKYRFYPKIARPNTLLLIESIRDMFSFLSD